jgi:hypothetical protein
MTVFRRRSFTLLCGGFLALAVISNFFFVSGATAVAVSAGTRAGHSAEAADGPLNPAALLAGAREMADARLIAEGVSPAKNPPRVGWFIPVDCYCRQATEQTFQDALAISAFEVAASLNGMSVRVQPKTYMKLNKKATNRIPDIYYFRLDKAHPVRGIGYLNELKVGDQAMSRGNSEASYDHNLYIQGYGIGSNTFDKGDYLPVTAVLWWFAPDVTGYTFYDANFFVKLLSWGINIVYMVQNDKAPPWPRPANKKQKAKDVKEIESNNQSTALAGLDNLMAPCTYSSTCPSP